MGESCQTWLRGDTWNIATQGAAWGTVNGNLSIPTTRDDIKSTLSSAVTTNADHCAYYNPATTVCSDQAKTYSSSAAYPMGECSNSYGNTGGHITTNGTSGGAVRYTQTYDTRLVY